MFLDFLTHLRSRGLKVSLTEWMGVMQALDQGLCGESLDRFHTISRALCVKNETHLDAFDQAFASYFQGVIASPDLLARVLEWLEKPVLPRDLSPEERSRLKALDLHELRRRFQELLDTQKERHDGGNKYIGTGGTSPFGHGGYNPAGIRAGGAGGNRSALKIATRRVFRNLRDDRVLDVRQISLALSALRRLTRDGAPDELDLESTVKRAGENAGDVELVFRRARKNSVKVALLMDVGGSMDDHVHVCELVFSAARTVHHFKQLKHFYFHNCPYEQLFEDISLRRGPATVEVLRDLDPSWYVLIVGDAAMAPTELLVPGGSIDWYHPNDEPGIVWLQRIARRFPRVAWLNPLPPAGWMTTTVRHIGQIFPMFPLTLGGLRDAVNHLRRTISR